MNISPARYTQDDREIEIFFFYFKIKEKKNGKFKKGKIMEKF